MLFEFFISALGGSAIGAVCTVYTMKARLRHESETSIRDRDYGVRIQLAEALMTAYKPIVDGLKVFGQISQGVRYRKYNPKMDWQAISNQIHVQVEEIHELKVNLNLISGPNVVLLCYLDYLAICAHLVAVLRKPTGDTESEEEIIKYGRLAQEQFDEVIESIRNEQLALRGGASVNALLAQFRLQSKSDE